MRLELDEIDKIQEAGVTADSVTEWESPIVLARKKDRSLRSCINFRQLNAVALRIGYLIPRMNKTTSSLGKAEMFSIFDARCKFWQIDIDDKDIETLE